MTAFAVPFSRKSRFSVRRRLVIAVIRYPRDRRDEWDEAAVSRYTRVSLKKRPADGGGGGGVGRSARIARERGSPGDGRGEIASPAAVTCTRV